MATKGKFSSMDIVTPEGIVAYEHLLEPRVQEDDNGAKSKGKYSLCLVFDTDSDEGQEFVNAVTKVAADDFCDGDLKKAAKQLKLGTLTSPMRPIEMYEDKGFPFDTGEESHVFVNPWTFAQKDGTGPGVYREVDGEAVEVTKAEHVYPGMKCKASVTVKTFVFTDDKTKMTVKGVNVYLNDVLITDKGKRIERGGESSTRRPEAFGLKKQSGASKLAGNTKARKVVDPDDEDN